MHETCDVEVDRRSKRNEWSAVNHHERLHARRKPPNPKRLSQRSPRSGSVQQVAGDEPPLSVSVLA